MKQNNRIEDFVSNTCCAIRDPPSTEYNFYFNNMKNRDQVQSNPATASSTEVALLFGQHEESQPLGWSNFLSIQREFVSEFSASQIC